MKDQHATMSNLLLHHGDQDRALIEFDHSQTMNFAALVSVLGAPSTPSPPIQSYTLPLLSLFPSLGLPILPLA